LDRESILKEIYTDLIASQYPWLNTTISFSAGKNGLAILEEPPESSLLAQLSLDLGAELTFFYIEQFRGEEGPIVMHADHGFGDMHKQFRRLAELGYAIRGEQIPLAIALNSVSATELKAFIANYTGEKPKGTKKSGELQRMAEKISGAWDLVKKTSAVRDMFLVVQKEGFSKDHMSTAIRRMQYVEDLYQIIDTTVSSIHANATGPDSAPFPNSTNVVGCIQCCEKCMNQKEVGSIPPFHPGCICRYEGAMGYVFPSTTSEKDLFSEEEQT